MWKTWISGAHNEKLVRISVMRLAGTFLDSTKRAVIEAYLEVILEDKNVFEKATMGGILIVLQDPPLDHDVGYSGTEDAAMCRPSAEESCCSDLGTRTQGGCHTEAAETRRDLSQWILWN
jgi:hypothetical protein